MPESYEVTSPPVADDRADPATADLFAGAKASLGFVPATYRSMARSPALLEVYRLGYARIREGSFSGPEQEVIFLTVSLLNECDYCIAAHSALAIEDFGLAPVHVEELRTGCPLSDPRLEALRAFTAGMVRTGGRPDRELADAFLAAGFEEAQMFEMVLAISMKMLSNFAGRLGAPEPDARFARYLQETGSGS